MADGYHRRINVQNPEVSVKGCNVHFEVVGCHMLCELIPGFGAVLGGLQATCVIGYIAWGSGLS